VLVGYAQGHPLTKKWTDKALSGCGQNINAMHSTMGRTLARAIRTAMLAELANKHWELLATNIQKGDATTYNMPNFPLDEVRGAGFHEAPRGLLSHWSVLERGQIRNYQAVVPTTWNASPRDKKGNSGPYEASLMNNPVAKPDAPLEVLRTVHSFDPCMACACHTFDEDGRKTAEVKVL
jgi:hydrogenase large subunit